MKKINIVIATLGVLILFASASAQRAELTLHLSEQFFEAFIEGVFHNFGSPEFVISEHSGSKSSESVALALIGSQNPSFFIQTAPQKPACKETVRILRENSGVRTAVKFRDGKVYMPLAFSGAYSPPFVGCVDFAGVAEANIDLEFDRDAQRLVGRVRVINVNLNGTGGVGGTVIARLIQRSIDKKLNPIEIVNLERLSFAVPVPNSGTVRMKAVSVRPEINSGFVAIHVVYEFLRV